MRALLIAIVAIALGSCIRPGSDRFDLDAEVGAGATAEIDIQVVDGQAQIQEAGDDGVIRLWAQSPIVEVVATNRAGTDRTVELIVDNVPETTAVTAADGRVRELASPRPIARRLELDIDAAATSTLRIAAIDAAEIRPFRFVVMGDVQTALDRFDDLLEAVGDVDGVEFIMSTGDLVEDAQDAEYELLDLQLERATVPFYSTIGNHELVREPEIWHRRFGRYNVHFIHRDVAFTFADSGNSTFDPKLRDELGVWLDESRDRVHLFGTHYPLIDPVGNRNASFRSRKEASAVLVELAEGRVDATFYGHIHSYYAYSNAGIPAFISGGGGAWPERLDGIGRHFLVVDVDPQRQLVEVGLVRID
jgi:3',5'-cyclic AMP phosphodiesterase CpdA